MNPQGDPMILTNAPCEHGWPLRECDRHAVPMPAADDLGLTVDHGDTRAAADLATAAAVVTAAVVVTVCVIVRDVIELILGRRKP